VSETNGAPLSPPRPPDGDDQTPNGEFYWSTKLEERLGDVRTVGNQWFVYNKLTGCWVQSECHVYRRIAMELLTPAKRTDRMAKSVVANLESRRQCADANFFGAIKFDGKNTVLVNTKRCVVRVDVDAVTTLPHDPKHGFTCALNVTYDPAATCPRFDMAMVQSLPDEQDQMLLLNFYGYTLLPDTRFQLALVCHGVTGSGKSTVMEPLITIFNHEALLTSFPIESICTGKDYCLTHFQHALVNVCGELSSMEVTESANFKSIVAGDVLQSRGIYDKATRLRSICKLIFLANNHPRFRNGTPAENRRLRMIHFCVVPKIIDNTLRPALGGADEVAGVFNHMLSRLQALFTMSVIPEGGKHSQAIRDAFNLSNAPIETFVERHCELHPDNYEPTDRISDIFANFVHTHGLHKGLNKGFLKRLREKFAGVSNYRPGHLERVRCLKGIKLKADVDQVLDKAPVDFMEGL
jgi:phage/plasmid-associated DNA primase